MRRKVVVCTSQVLEIRRTYYFVKNLAHFVLKIELLFTVLSTFEREAPLIRITFSMGSMFDP